MNYLNILVDVFLSKFSPNKAKLTEQYVDAQCLIYKITHGPRRTGTHHLPTANQADRSFAV